VNEFQKQKLAGSPNLADHTKFGNKLEEILVTPKNLVVDQYVLKIYITNTPKIDSVGFDPGTSA
jgi:hypothetical protein